MTENQENPPATGNRNSPHSQRSDNGHVTGNESQNVTRSDGRLGSTRRVDNVAVTSAHSTHTPVVNGPAEDTWSLPSYRAPYRNQSRTNSRHMCGCIPDLSQAGISSMLYEQHTCGKYGLTGYTHRNVKRFEDNWTRPGVLPPIHQTDFMSKRDPIKPKPGYTVSLGYPPTAHGGIRLSDEEEDSYDSDEEYEEEEDLDDEAFQEDQNQQDSSTSNQTVHKHNAKSEPRYLTEFPYTPRAVVSEERLPEGYIPPSQIYDLSVNHFVQSRLKKGRGHVGNVYNPVTRKLEHFELQACADDNIRYDRQSLTSADLSKM